MPSLTASGLSGYEATQSLFGANVLATRSDLQQGGDYDQLIDAMGVGSFRYPGGSLTERYFDIANPNARIVTDRDTGETREFIPLNDALGYAAAEGLSVTIVIPTRHLLTDRTDDNGDRFADVDEGVLRGFISDVVSGVHGDAQIDGFQLGNEYWGSGKMSSVEYGRLASEMSVIINDELDAQGSDAGIIVQSGTNFNYARLSQQFDDDQAPEDILADLNTDYGLTLGADALTGAGDVNWTHVANEMILTEFDTAAEQQAVDAVSAHVYSKAQAGGQRDFYLDQADEDWGDVLPEADLVVTEWNTSGRSEQLDRHDDYGLFQAHEVLNIVEEFMDHDVQSAHVWPLLQNTANTLSRDDGQTDLTPAGAMFNLLQAALPGKTAIDLTPESDGRTEMVEDELAVHGFWEPNDLVFFIAATGDTGADSSVDFSDLVRDTGDVSVTLLRVADGADAGSNRSDAVVEAQDSAELLDGTTLSANLNTGEILQVRMQNFAPSDGFQDVLSADAADDLPDPVIDAFRSEEVESILPTRSVEEDSVAPELENEGESSDSSDDGMADMALTLPLLALLMMLL